MSDARPIITVEGQRVSLGPIRRDLIPLYHAWITDISTNRFLLASAASMTLDAEVEWFEGISKRPDTAIFTIYELPDYRPIGNVDLHGIDRVNRSAELGIMIGEADARGRGLGTEAVRLMCDIGFHVLGLNSIWLVTFGWNVAGQKAYERAGFREIGRRREARWFDGRYWDDILYDVLRSDFESPAVRHIMMDGIPTD
jgi:RimJ/RimL family protein N-acetyltransferase